MDYPITAATPTGPVDVPPIVAKLADGAAVTPVWRNELDGLTFRLDSGDDTRFVKWVAAGTPGIDLRGEALRLAWIGSRLAVPRVLDQGSDDDGDWLLTAAVPGGSAVDERWRTGPVASAKAAASIGHGLRILHDRLPVDDCPFDWSVVKRLRRADERIATGGTPADWFPEHRHLDLRETRFRMSSPPPVDRPVVCHGDACVPNTLLHPDGSFAGHVDLGSLGVADRWADLAVAAWSTEWNYGPGYDGILYEAYGVEPDRERIAYYRLLWDIC